MHWPNLSNTMFILTVIVDVCRGGGGQKWTRGWMEGSIFLPSFMQMSFMDDPNTGQ